MIRRIFSAAGCCLLLLLTGLTLPVLAQPGATVQLDKPKKYENRTLASEKSGEGKLNPLKKANQNLNSLYNFYFNANRKLDEIVADAKMSTKDNFGKLLPFYNFTLDQTASQSRDLDSVILRCNDAILLHDLRSDWVDDLYLLMGKAYFYKKDLDSAAIAFQYVNFAFQPRTKDEIGYNKSIGSNLNSSGNVYTISTKENKNLVVSTLGHTPARNESLIWLVRTLMAHKEYNAAWSLIGTLDRDVNFPSRLRTVLTETRAYWYYLQENYDSSAFYLAKSLDNAPTQQERSRWEYLLGQMEELNGDLSAADGWYGKVIGHTTDPILEAYARISQVRIIAGDDLDKRIDMNLEELKKMAKKDKYEDYRHMIFFAAAQMELKRNHTDEAIAYLEESAKYGKNDPTFRTSAYLLLADLAFQQRKYQLAAAGYDSIDLSDPAIPEPEMLNTRKAILNQVVRHLETVRVEDSLQRIAAMPEAERNAYIKSQVRKLRKEQGLKEEELAQSTGGAGISSVLANAPDNKPADLFAGNTTKGEWYFYNTSLKQQGQRQFKNVWGDRPNVDNWRRTQALAQQMKPTPSRPGIPDEQTAPQDNTKAQPKELTVEALRDNLPLTPEKQKASRDTIESALNQLGKIYRERLGDCPSLISNNEDLLNRNPSTKYAEEALFGLYYCQTKAGNTEKAKFYKDYLEKNYRQSRYLRMINDPKGLDAENKTLVTAATKKYDEVYTKFIEGDFRSAVELKKKADSLYGANYWTPQLLYIESVYYIKDRQDSAAITTLQNLIQLYPESPMKAKAATMIDVLKNRQKIEDYLTRLDVKRVAEDSVAYIPEPPITKAEVTLPAAKPAPVKPENNKPITAKADTSNFRAPVMEKKAEGYTFKPADQYFVVLLLNKVDIVYVNEAKNALNRYNKEKFYAKPLELAQVQLDDARKMITIAAFDNILEARDYQEKASKSASSDIFPWMPKDKFFFFVISGGNLEILKTRKDVEEYQKLLLQNIPVK